MRRVAGLVLSALGTFLIVLALLTKFVVAGEAVKFPLNENTVTTLIAQNAKYFNTSQLAVETGVTLEDTLTTQGDNAAGSSGTAVWNQFNYVYDKTNFQTVSYSTDRYAFDRKSGELSNCCGAAIGTNTKVHFSGLGLVWPLNAQKQTYPVFNTTLLKPVPAVYSGTASVQGENTYKYVQTVQPTQIGTQAVPGALIGQPSEASVTLPEFFAGTTTEWVDPVTGAPVKGVSTQHQYLADASGNEVLTLIDATFATTPASIASTLHTARNYDSQINLVQVVLPLILGIVGVILLLMGLVLFFTSRPRDAEYVEDHEVGEVPA
jgi:Porin PorA